MGPSPLTNSQAKDGHHYRNTTVIASRARSKIGGLFGDECQPEHSLFSFDSVVVNFSIECGTADTQQFRRFGDVVAGALQCIDD